MFFYVIFYDNNQKVNSTFGFRKRTFINVQNRNPKRTFEKQVLKTSCDHNGLKNKKYGKNVLR